jgi:hypothetical protein
MTTFSVMEKIRLAKSPEYKLPLVMFSRLRALLMILLSYLRTIDGLVKKK